MDDTLPLDEDVLTEYREAPTEILDVPPPTPPREREPFELLKRAELQERIGQPVDIFDKVKPHKRRDEIFKGSSKLKAPPAKLHMFTNVHPNARGGYARRRELKLGPPERVKKPAKQPLGPPTKPPKKTKKKLGPPQRVPRTKSKTSKK